jgi:GntR family transcriptional regulator
MTQLVRLDPRSHLPIYLQVVEQIRHLVAAGLLRPGNQLPTVRQLAVDLRLNPNTVARAYAQLAEDGVISTQQGRGTYVLEHPPSPDQRRLRREKLIALVEALFKEAERLGYTAEELEKAWTERLTARRRSQAK